MWYEAEVTFENSVSATPTSGFSDSHPHATQSSGGCCDSEGAEVKVQRDLAREFFEASQKVTHEEFFKSKNNFHREGLRGRPSVAQQKCFYKLMLTTVHIETRLFIWRFQWRCFIYTILVNFFIIEQMPLPNIRKWSYTKTKLKM